MSDRVVTYEAEDGFRWRYVKEENDKVMADGGQGYSDSRDLVHGIDVVFGGDPPEVILPDGTVHVLPQSEAVKNALALLSLLTGDAWDEQRLRDEGERLRAVAKGTLRTKHGMTSDDAEAIVAERWENYAAPIVNNEPPADPALVQSPIVAVPPTAEELGARLADYKERTGTKTETDPSEEKSVSAVERLREAKATAAARSARRQQR